MELQRSSNGRIPVVFILLLFLGPAVGYSQSGGEDAPYHVSFSASKNGGTMRFSGPKNSLAIDIVGDTIQTTDQPNYLVVDNLIVQASMVPLPGGVDGSQQTVARQKEILSGYVGYEMDYFQKELKLATSGLKREWLTIGERTFLMWTFHLDPPKGGKTSGSGNTIIGQIYLSVLWHDQVLDLNSALTDEKDAKRAKDLLQRMGGSIRSVPPVK
jgi:hypothetical protein